jgi:hypothetical protein
VTCVPVSWIDSVAGAEQDGQVLLFTRWPGLTGYRDGHEHWGKDLPLGGDYTTKLEVDFEPGGQIDS